MRDVMETSFRSNNAAMEYYSELYSQLYFCSLNLHGKYTYYTILLVDMSAYNIYPSLNPWSYRCGVRVFTAADCL